MNILKKTTIAIAGAALLLTGVNSASAESLKSLEAKWGKPVSIKKLTNGSERRVYGEKDVEVGYFYFIIKDGQVIDRGVTPNPDRKESRKANIPTISGLMGSYYKNNKTKVADIKAKFGEPVNTSRYDNGMERLVFGPYDSNAGYRVFVADKGTIVDEGRTSILVKVEKEAEGPSISSFMASWYKKHPKSVSELKAEFGEPTSVKVYKNGMKRVVFGPKDVVIGSNYFIVKDGQVIDSGYSH